MLENLTIFIFKICGYSDEANDVLAAARGGGGGSGS